MFAALLHLHCRASQIANAVATGGLRFGTNASEELVGTNASELLIGAAGNDVLRGGSGNDTYLWARGHGNDTIIEPTNQGSNDVLILAGIDPADVTLVREGITVTLVIAESAPGAGDGGSVRIVDSFGTTAERGVERIMFSDGEAWNRARMQTEVWMSGTAGDDVLVGTAGADRIWGGAGDDVIDGGAGNDVLAGGAGVDTFVFRPGGGQDRILDFVPTIDRIALESGLAPEDLSLTEIDGGTLIAAAEGTSFWLAGVTGTQLSDYTFV